MIHAHMSSSNFDVVFVSMTDTEYSSLSRTGLVFELPLHFASNTLQHVLGHMLGFPSKRACPVRFTPVVCTVLFLELQ